MATEQAISLSDAVSQYMGTLTSQRRREEQQEVNRFLKWYGRDRAVIGMTPDDVAQYGVWVSTETPDPATRLNPVRAFLSYLKKSGVVSVTLASHLRIPKAKRFSRAAAAKSAPEPVELSAEGYANLQARMSTLQKDRINVVADIKRAMADKDFKENSPLEAAKERQGQIESNLREVQETLQRATIRETGKRASSSQVKLGHTVALKEMASGKIINYTLVDPAEADPTSGKISSISPVGRAIMEKWVGEEISVSVPRGTFSYRIERIKS